jgi:hypothetical protein
MKTMRYGLLMLLALAMVPESVRANCRIMQCAEVWFYGRG